MKHTYRLLSIAMTACLVAPVSAKKADPEIEKLKSRIEQYVAKVDSQPDWLYSRLQMYWNTQAAQVYINGEQFDHPGGPRAGVPTVKLNGTRGTASEYNRPRLEDIIPYDDDPEGNVTYISRATGKMEKAHPSRTGCNIASVNRQIVSIARDAARVYAATGDKRYGQMAAQVFTVYMKGIEARNVPYDLNHGHQQTLVGMTTFEVIHEDIINELTEMYPLIRLLVANDKPTIDRAFKKWADNIIANGVPHNNWDLFQADFIAKIALILDDDKAYTDGKGRQYYLDHIVNQSSIRQWGMTRLIDFGFDPRAKTWYESPGYSTTVLGDLSQFANRLDQQAGIDLFALRPVIQEAVAAQAEYLFPNRMIAGFGDTHPNYLSTKSIDQLADYARRHKLTATVKAMENLKAAVSPDAPAAAAERYTSGIFYAPNVSWLMMRSGMDPQHDLAASLNASLGNHQHANGISLELYGKGYVLGPDAGIGRHLYSGLDYAEYYSQMPAHNTVVVDGISSYPVMMSNHTFHVTHSQPSVDTMKVSGGKLAERKEPMTYATVTFTEPETGALQQRTTAVVKTSGQGGYYIDIFRSRKQEGGDKTHDYFYHNLGQTMTLTTTDGRPVSTTPTDELAFAGGHLYAYSYLYNKECAEANQAVKVTFTTQIEDPKTVEALYGQHTVTMTLWMNPDKDRTLFKALSPANLEYERMAHQPYKVERQPVLTFVARQRGEAWAHPFVAVYEPSSDTEPGDIADVTYFTPDNPGAVGIRVRLKDGSTQRFVCTDDGQLEMKQ